MASDSPRLRVSFDNMEPLIVYLSTLAELFAFIDGLHLGIRDGAHIRQLEILETKATDVILPLTSTGDEHPETGFPRSE